jgi:hypothetical protein
MGFVYAGWIEHYGANMNTVGKAQVIKRRKGNHQRDCPFRDFHYLPTCVLFTYNMTRAEAALRKFFAVRFKRVHPKGDWFYCSRAEAIAAFHEFCQQYHEEEERHAADDSTQRLISNLAGSGDPTADREALAASEQQVHRGRYLPLAEAIESESEDGSEANDSGGGDSGC